MQTATQTQSAYTWQRRAAEAGPGLRGKRRSADPARRAEIASALESFGLPAPAHLSVDVEWLERRAKLFESGDYADKGLNITAADLERLEASFDLPVPVLIEHADTPFQMGFLTDVEALGNELFGTIALTPEANALIEANGARSLSLGLAKGLDRIQEVSLVSNPRVATAQLFSEEQTVLFGELGPDAPHASKAQAERLAEELCRAGRLTPAQLPAAITLLQVEQPVFFEGQKRPLNELVREVFDRQPARPLFQQQAPSPSPAAEAALLLPEEAAFYRKHFPDVSLEEIARVR